MGDANIILLLHGGKNDRENINVSVSSRKNKENHSVEFSWLRASVISIFQEIDFLNLLMETKKYTMVTFQLQRII